MSKFDAITYDIAEKIVGAARPQDYEQNKRFHDGDHWQNGEGWVGPRPPAGDASYMAVLTLIEGNFVYRNVVAEGVGRHINSVLGVAPHWKLTPIRPLAPDEQPSAEEQALIDEAQAALQEWTDKRLWANEQPVQTALLTALLGDRSVLRLFVPPEAQRVMTTDEGQTSLDTPDLTAALDTIYVQEVAIDKATVWTDKRSQQKVGVYTYREEDDFGLGDVEEGDYAELTYLGDAGQTVVRVIDRSGETGEGVILDLGGRITLYQIERQALIGGSVRSLQKLLNMNYSMWARNAVLAGYLERVILNGTAAVEMIDDHGVKRFVPKAYKVGAGVTNSIIGVEVTNQDGSRSVAQPEVLWRDPVDVTNFKETRVAIYTAILEEIHQLHYMIAGDAASSGASRQQAVADFEADLQITAKAISGAMRWLLETALAMASALTGQAGRYSGLRAYVDVKVTPTPLTPDEKRVNSEMVDKEMMSRERGMSENGVQDVDAELTKIKQEREDFNQNPLDEVQAMQAAIGKTGIKKTLTGDDDERPVPADSR